MKTKKATYWAAGLIAAATLCTCYINAAESGANETGATIRERFHARMVALGITSEQRDQLRAVLREFQPTVKPLVEKCIQERRTLREMIHATPANDAAIRSQSAKVAACEADLAVARAQIVEKIRPILSNEQLQELRRMEDNAYSRIDEGLARFSRWIEGK